MRQLRRQDGGSHFQIDGVTYARVSYLAQKLTLEADDARYDDILAEVVKTCKRVEPDCRILLK